MSVLAVGLSHRTAPTDLLERVSAGIGDSVKLLHQLAEAEHVAEAVVLSTCNRVEIYTHVTAFHGGHVDVTDALSDLAGVPVDELSPHLYVDYDARAIQHLFQVVCGLDSMLIGETQIGGQARSAYKQAEVEGTLGRVLGEAFRHALRVGKRARSQTGIDRAGASLVSIAVSRAEELIGPIHGRTVGVVGAGATGSLAATTLRRAGASVILVANRGAEAARRLADRMTGESIDLGELSSLLARADVVSIATASVHTVITVDDVRAALVGRAGRPLVLLDLGLPRNVDPLVRALPGVSVIDLDDLGAGLAQEPGQRDVEAAAAIVAEEVTAFLGWQRAIRVAPTVIALRSKAETVVRGELERLLGRLPDLDEHTRREVEDTVRRVVEKLIHAPTVRVKELASDPGGDAYADALRELFELPRVLPEALAQPASPDSEGGAE